MTEPEDGRGTAVIMPAPEESGPSAAITERTEFIRAFVEHAADPPASERLGIRWPTLITVTALSLVGALVIGIFWSLISPQKKVKTGPQAGPNGAPVAGAPATWTSIAGWDCGTANDHGFEATGRASDWRTEPSGGWRQDGCHGTYETVPVPRATDKSTSAQGVDWWFAPPSGMNSCRVSVYVPKTDDPASTVRYAMTANGNGTPYANFSIDQSKHPDSWVDAGSFPVHQNKIAVGFDVTGATGEPGRRIAIAQVKVDCGH